MEFLAGSLLELITQTSINLPPDVRAAMSIAAKEETPDTQSSQAFDIILSNIDMAVAEATWLGKLRPNSVDSLTGKNSGDNLGEETPVLHFDQWEKDDIEIKLILKGGGCENKNIQYSVPCTLDHMGRADRNLEGVRKCVL